MCIPVERFHGRKPLRRSIMKKAASSYLDLPDISRYQMWTFRHLWDVECAGGMGVSR